ncbi:hypothetical protein ACFQ14_12355 [Pseudahrensia aquimaris]|uniref:GIY-YIG domain-containing protein n=1 Tax=Pseudahrensia aquimaris TaxID=744461 RepID=A0ABW3FHH8_9HYPH
MEHRKYAVRPFAKLPGLNYAHAQPFRNWPDNIITSAIGGWLKENPPGLELATLALDELQRRGKDLNAGMRFAEAGLEPIPWLAEAGAKVREVFTSEVLSTQKQGALRGSVYVMLRGGYTAENGWYGCYVGSTKKSPARRCTEHRKCIRAGRGLPTHGIEPLWSLFDFINPVPVKRDVLMEWETRLHEALAPVVPKVTGDVAF